MRNPPSTQEQDLPHIEVWNDLVSLRDLVTCLVVAVVGVTAAVIAARLLGGQLLFWGLGASVVGFLVSCRLVTPKREVRIVDDPAVDDRTADPDDQTRGADQAGPRTDEQAKSDPGPGTARTGSPADDREGGVR